MKTSNPLSAILVFVATTALATQAKAQTSSCAADTDCGTGMVCRSQTFTTCTGGTARTPCTSDTVCDPVNVEPPTCSESTLNQCVCRWPLSCNADSDCGDGFFCRPTTMTTCSGSSGTGSAGTGTATRSPGGGTGAASGGSSSGVGGGSGGTSAPIPVPSPDAVPTVDAGVSTPPACTSSTSYPGTCQPKVTTCNSDADCPSPWTCVAAGLPVAVASPPQVDAGVAVPLPPDVAASATATATATTTTTTSVKVCQSPCGRTYGGSDGTQGTGTIALHADAGTTKGTTPTVPPVVAPSDEGSGPAGDSTDAKTTTAAKTGGSGCSIGSGDVGGGAALLLGLAVAAARVGRRRRWN